MAEQTLPDPVEGPLNASLRVILTPKTVPKSKKSKSADIEVPDFLPGVTGEYVDAVVSRYLTENHGIELSPSEMKRLKEAIIRFSPRSSIWNRKGKACGALRRMVERRVIIILDLSMSMATNNDKTMAIGTPSSRVIQALQSAQRRFPQVVIDVFTYGSICKKTTVDQLKPHNMGTTNFMEAVTVVDAHIATIPKGVEIVIINVTDGEYDKPRGALDSYAVYTLAGQFPGLRRASELWAGYVSRIPASAYSKHAQFLQLMVSPEATIHSCYFGIDDECAEQFFDDAFKSATAAGEIQCPLPFMSIGDYAFLMMSPKELFAVIRTILNSKDVESTRYFLSSVIDLYATFRKFGDFVASCRHPVIRFLYQQITPLRNMLMEVESGPHATSAAVALGEITKFMDWLIEERDKRIEELRRNPEFAKSPVLQASLKELLEIFSSLKKINECNELLKKLANIARKGDVRVFVRFFGDATSIDGLDATKFETLSVEKISELIRYLGSLSVCSRDDPDAMPLTRESLPIIIRLAFKSQEMSLSHGLAYRLFVLMHAHLATDCSISQMYVQSMVRRILMITPASLIADTFIPAGKNLCEVYLHALITLRTSGIQTANIPESIAEMILRIRAREFVTSCAPLDRTVVRETRHYLEIGSFVPYIIIADAPIDVYTWLGTMRQDHFGNRVINEEFWTHHVYPGGMGFHRFQQNFRNFAIKHYPDPYYKYWSSGSSVAHPATIYGGVWTDLFRVWIEEAWQAYQFATGTMSGYRHPTVDSVEEQTRVSEFFAEFFCTHPITRVTTEIEQLPIWVVAAQVDPEIAQILRDLPEKIPPTGLKDLICSLPRRDLASCVRELDELEMDIVRRCLEKITLRGSSLCIVNPGNGDFVTYRPPITEYDLESFDFARLEAEAGEMFDLHDYTCPICQEIPSPEGGCLYGGHVYCEVCLDNWFTRSGSRASPLTRQTHDKDGIPLQITHLMSLRRILARLYVPDE